MEQNLYEGRKGQKKLRAIERQIQEVSSEIQNCYEDTPEMMFLEEEVEWEAVAKLIFVMAFRKVHFMWNGIRDYGYIRLCEQWVKKQDLKTVTSSAAMRMVQGIFTEEMLLELREELDALEMA